MIQRSVLGDGFKKTRCLHLGIFGGYLRVLKCNVLLQIVPFRGTLFKKCDTLGIDLGNFIKWTNKPTTTSIYCTISGLSGDYSLRLISLKETVSGFTSKSTDSKNWCFGENKSGYLYLG